MMIFTTTSKASSVTIWRFLPTLTGLSNLLRPVLFLLLIAQLCPTCMAEDALVDELLRREIVPLSRKHIDPTIQRALSIVDQDLNPIKITNRRGAEEIFSRTTKAPPSPGLIAFRAPESSDPNIYVNSEGQDYKEATEHPDDALAQLLLAATLVHEQIHNTDGERAARRKQADFLRSKLPTLSKGQQRRLWSQIEAMDRQALPPPTTLTKK